MKPGVARFCAEGVPAGGEERHARPTDSRDQRHEAVAGLTEDRLIGGGRETSNLDRQALTEVPRLTAAGLVIYHHLIQGFWLPGVV